MRKRVGVARHSLSHWSTNYNLVNRQEIEMKAGWIYPFIIAGGVLQTCGAAMNGQLNKSLVNPSWRVQYLCPHHCLLYWLVRYLPYTFTDG